ncbi:protein TolR [Flagellatimonas centrodinii]|uniref:protein TolR n=1 Tax=Flagellatimonas centrodinii TaxID=2806210 RepID=UPI001FEDEA4C|nr:protein TolR [Flagellatimonas centrodinii]ULQ46475.1 protein TolR [Flagellatimonas centrodinii]
MARRKLSSEINVVPYIDVMLVLLVIFMVTAPLLTQGIEVDLPKTQSQTLSSQQEPTVVSVDTAGNFYLNRGEDTEAPLSEAELSRRVAILIRNQPDDLILVEGDGKAEYAAVAKAMGVLQGAGVKKIGFVTEPAELQR